MTKLAGVLAVLALAIAGCGSSSGGGGSGGGSASGGSSSGSGTSGTNTVVQQATNKIDAVLKKCLPTKSGLPDVTVLRTSAGRTAFINCAVPPAQQVAFKQCVTSVLLGGLPTKSRIESGINDCLTKAGV